MVTGTKKQILDLLKRRGILSIDEITRGLKPAKTTLREHLLQLESETYIKRTYVSSGPGRPGLHYELTALGHSVYPSGESELMRNFLAYLKNRGEESAIEDFFEGFWDQRLQKAGRLMEKQPLTDRKAQTDELMKMLADEGFMPEYELDEDRNILKVRECNCPFSEVVKETRLPCKLEAEFYRRLFGVDVERTSYIADGDHSCSYSIFVK